MKIHPTLYFYNKIIEAEDAEAITKIDLEVKSAVLSKILTDDKDIMILNLALQMKSNFFLLKETRENNNGTTIIVVGDTDDIDFEQMELDKMQEEELNDLAENVVTMNKFKKDKDK